MRHTASMNPSVRLLTTPYDSIFAPSIPLAGFDRASAVDLPCMPCLSVCHFWCILAISSSSLLWIAINLYTRTEHYLSSSSLRHPGAHAFCRLVSKHWLQFIDSSPLLLSAVCIASISSSTYPVPTALLSSIHCEVQYCTPDQRIRSLSHSHDASICNTTHESQPAPNQARVRHD